jgi:hypothetical protein
MIPPLLPFLLCFRICIHFQLKILEDTKKQRRFSCFRKMLHLKEFGTHVLENDRFGSIIKCIRIPNPRLLPFSPSEAILFPPLFFGCCHFIFHYQFFFYVFQVQYYKWAPLILQSLYTTSEISTPKPVTNPAREDPAAAKATAAAIATPPRTRKRGRARGREAA